MRVRDLLPLLLLFQAFALFAQTNAGSPYSAFGLGNLRPTDWGIHAGLAGGGIAWSSDALYNYRNPASNAFIRQPYNMILEFGGDLSLTEVANTSNSVSQRDGGLSNFLLWLRPQSKWSTSLGLVPYSTMRYSILSERVLANIGTPYNLLTEGEGGLNRLFWSNSLEVTPRLAIGLTAHLVFGSLQQTEEVLPNADLSPFSVDVQTAMRGVQWQAGLSYDLPIGEAELRLGTSLTTGADLVSRQTTTLRSGLETLEEVAAREEGRYRLPLRCDAGIGLTKGKWQWSAEVEYEQSSVISGEEQAAFVDTWRAITALEWHWQRPNHRDDWDGIRLRAGFSYGNSNLTMDGEQWDRWEVTTGFMLPVGPNSNHLQLSYGYGQQGTQANGLLSEVQHRLTLNFTLRDIWFLKRKFG